jgi:hypothetical protein
MDGTGLGQCVMVGSGISSVEPGNSHSLCTISEFDGIKCMLQCRCVLFAREVTCAQKHGAPSEGDAGAGS